MKALIKKKAEKGIWLGEHPKPEIGYNDVLIKVTKTAICGTDMHIYQWDEWAKSTVPLGMHIGHEFVGKVEGMGAGVQGLNIGQRVSGEGHITCGYCRNCRAGRLHLCNFTIGVGVNRPGAFAEYLSIPASNVFPIPDEVNDELASILDPFGNATHTALSFDLIGEDVLITGAGPIGIMAVAICKHAGARHVVITDVNDYRLNIAQKMGATKAINITTESLNDTMKSLRMTEGFDIGLEMSGNSIAFKQMLDVMNFGGKISLLGILEQSTTIDWNKVIFKGLIIKGIYGREMYESWYKMISMLQSGIDIKPVITHTFSIREYQKGFDIMESGCSGKVVLDWSYL